MVQQRRLFYTALAALSTHPTAVVEGFTCPSPALINHGRSYHGTSASTSTSVGLRNPSIAPLPHNVQIRPAAFMPPYIMGSTRLFSSLFQNSPNPKKKKGILERAAEKVKQTGSQILPSVFGAPTPEQERKIELKRQQKAAKNEIDTMLKDAPLAIRLLGKAITPLISSMAGAFAEQSAAMADVLQDAQDMVGRDAELAARLGSPVQLGPPFGQSSSSANINGQVSSQVRLQLPVMGSNGTQGTASILAVNGIIEDFTVDVNGQYYYVTSGGSSSSTTAQQVMGTQEVYTSGSSRGSSTSKIGKNSKMDNVIDAEFVEKK